MSKNDILGRSYCKMLFSNRRWFIIYEKSQKDEGFRISQEYTFVREFRYYVKEVPLRHGGIGRIIYYGFIGNMPFSIIATKSPLHNVFKNGIIADKERIYPD